MKTKTNDLLRRCLEALKEYKAQLDRIYREAEQYAPGYRSHSRFTVRGFKASVEYFQPLHDELQEVLGDVEPAQRDKDAIPELPANVGPELRDLLLSHDRRLDALEALTVPQHRGLLPFHALVLQEEDIKGLREEWNYKVQSTNTDYVNGAFDVFQFLNDQLSKGKP